MVALIFHAPPVAPLLPSSSSDNIHRYTYHTSATRHVIPDLSGAIVTDARVPTVSGGFTDVSKCTWIKDTGSAKVRSRIEPQPLINLAAGCSEDVPDQEYKPW